jgi:hypothetical protein
MYTFVRVDDNIVQETGVSAADRSANNYADAGLGILSVYETDSLTGTPIVGVSKPGETSWELIIFDEIREIRDKMLIASDWRDLPSYPGNDQIAWRAYRDKLRSLPQDFASVADIEFPIEPNT